MRAKSETVALATVAALHLAVQIVHGWSHDVAEVALSLPEQAFILVVVTAMPWAAIAVGWRWGTGKGAVLFALSMALSFLFGYVFHFVVDGPDLHANVAVEHRAVFFHSAAGLALLEFSGFVLGLFVMLRPRR